MSKKQVYPDGWDRDLPTRVCQAYYELDDDDLHHYAAGLAAKAEDRVDRQLVATTHALAFAVATIAMMKAKVQQSATLAYHKRDRR
jgi:hypothetical protein